MQRKEERKETGIMDAGGRMVDQFAELSAGGSKEFFPSRQSDHS
jgi:hypothetical protein